MLFNESIQEKAEVLSSPAPTCRKQKRPFDNRLKYIAKGYVYGLNQKDPILRLNFVCLDA